jgi:predicted  nucleic acid-binding Zn-ribbon protein
MKIPSKLIICGREYKVIKDKNLLGGRFECGKQTIRIGLKEKHPDQIRDTILHEIIEVILTERNLRYKLNYIEDENGHYLFSFNHNEFENWIIDLGCALKSWIR